MVTCTGFGPVNNALRGHRVEPLHQQVISYIYYQIFLNVAILIYKYKLKESNLIKIDSLLFHYFRFY